LTAKEKSFVYEPEKVADGVYTLPVPFRPGSPVNVHVIVGNDGAYLIDSGPPFPHSQQSLVDQLKMIGLTLKDVRQCIITHPHGDHQGGAPVLIEAGVEVFVHPNAVTNRLINSDAEADRLLARHGQNLKRPDEMDPNPDLTPGEQPIPDGTVLDWGGFKVEVNACLGHSNALLCMYMPNEKILFSSDHLMRRAHAPISVYTEKYVDPMTDYLASMNKLAKLKVDHVLPGHGRPFTGFDQRVEQVQEWVDGRIAVILDNLTKGPTTAYELGEDRRMGFINEWTGSMQFSRRHATAQTLAYLAYLEGKGQVTRDTSGEVVTFKLAA
jgi:glyoxylase-like metal-dependent hydrolase (beta-lactamase superfamily II)